MMIRDFVYQEHYVTTDHHVYLSHSHLDYTNSTEHVIAILSVCQTSHLTARIRLTRRLKSSCP